MLRPVPARLLLRPGARYECHGDGTCCTGIHLIGPISRREADRVRDGARLALPSCSLPIVRHDAGVEGWVVNTANGSCVFLDDKLGCRLHAIAGPEFKSAACRRFPLGTTGTPDGLRVTLSHRCACVSIGESALLTEASARSALQSPGTARLLHDHDVDDFVPWRTRRRVRFDDYVVWERSILASLDREEAEPSVEEILGIKRAEALPELRNATWGEVTKQLVSWTSDEPDDDGFSCALRWVALAISPQAWKTAPAPKRPWAWTFDRAKARTRDPMPLRKIYGSWLADEVWAMGWTYWGSVSRLITDLRARYILATRIAERIAQLGERYDIATAESVMIVDVLGAADTWTWVRKRLIGAGLTDRD